MKVAFEVKSGFGICKLLHLSVHNNSQAITLVSLARPKSACEIIRNMRVRNLKCNNAAVQIGFLTFNPFQVRTEQGIPHSTLLSIIARFFPAHSVVKIMVFDNQLQPKQFQQAEPSSRRCSYYSGSRVTTKLDVQHVDHTDPPIVEAEREECWLQGVVGEQWNQQDVSYLLDLIYSRERKEGRGSVSSTQMMNSS